MKYSWTGHKISYNGIFKDKKLLQLEHAPLGLNYCISSGFLHLKSYLIFLRKNFRPINLILFGDATLNHSNARY